MHWPRRHLHRLWPICNIAERNLLCRTLSPKSKSLLAKSTPFWHSDARSKTSTEESHIFHHCLNPHSPSPILHPVPRYRSASSYHRHTHTPASIDKFHNHRSPRPSHRNNVSVCRPCSLWNLYLNITPDLILINTSITRQRRTSYSGSVSHSRNRRSTLLNRDALISTPPNRLPNALSLLLH